MPHPHPDFRPRQMASAWVKVVIIGLTLLILAAIVPARGQIRGMNMPITSEGEHPAHASTASSEPARLTMRRYDAGNVGLLTLRFNQTDIFTFTQGGAEGFWKIDLIRISDSHKVTLRPSDANTVTGEHSRKSGATTWSDFGEYDITVTQNWFLRQGNELAMRLTIQNESDSYGIDSVKFPLLSFTVDDSIKHDLKFAFPKETGYLITDPLASDATWRYNYPSRGIMQFTSAYADDAGLMIMDEDENGYRKEYWTITTADANRVDTYVKRFPANTFLAGEDFTMDYDTIITPVTGNWYDVARKYRSWALTSSLVSQGPLSTRTDIPTWYKDAPATFVIFSDDTTVPHSVWPDRAQAFLDALDWPAGAKAPLFWYSWQHWEPSESVYCTVLGMCDPDKIPTADVHAGTYFPARPDLTDAIDQLIDENLYPVMFLNTRLFDYEAPGSDDFLPAVIKDKDGNTVLYSDSHPGWDMCRSTQLWQDQYYELAETMFSDFHAKGIYLDSMGGDSHHCFVAEHGHDMGGGTYSGHSQRHFSEHVRQLKQSNPESIFIMEDGPDYLIDVTDGTLSHQNAYAERIPLRQAVYHDYWLSFGRTLSAGYADTENLYEAFCGVLFNSGQQLGRIDITHSDFIDSPEYSAQRAFLSELINLKYAARPWLNYGTMMRPPATSGIPNIATTYHDETIVLPAVLTSVWDDPDGNLALVVTNISHAPHTFDVTLDLDQYDVPPASLYQLRDFQHEEDVVCASTTRLMQCTLTLDALDARVYELSW